MPAVLIPGWFIFLSALDARLNRYGWRHQCTVPAFEPRIAVR